MTLALILLLAGVTVLVFGMLAAAHNRPVSALDEQLAAADRAAADHHRPAAAPKAAA